MTDAWQSTIPSERIDQSSARAPSLDTAFRSLRVAAERTPETFVFGPFQLEPARQLLLRNGQPVKLGSRALLILLALVRGAGRMVHRDELFAAAWPGTFVDDCNLRAQIAGLRRALGDGKDGTRLIVNVPGRGYQFVEAVRRASCQDLPFV